MNFQIGETSDSHGGRYEDDCLLGCCAIQSDRSLQTFQRCLLLTSSGRSLVMEAVSTSETSVNFYHTTQLNIPEDNHLQLSDSLLNVTLDVTVISIGGKYSDGNSCSVMF
jgi:hypothetical protein